MLLLSSLFPFLLLKKVSAIILPGFWGKRHSTSLPEPVISVFWFSFSLERSDESFGSACPETRLCHQIHISQTMQHFFGTRIRTETKTTEWKQSWRIPAPNSLATFTLKIWCATGSWSLAEPAGGPVRVCQALVGAGTWTPLGEKGQCVPLLRWQDVAKVCPWCGNSEQGWWHGTLLLVRLKTTDSEFLLLNSFLPRTSEF